MEHKEFKTTTDYLENIGWKCPNSIKLELFEIYISTSIDIRRFRKNNVKIKEIFLPEFNLSINNEYFMGKNYNIISNASGRFYSSTNTNMNTELTDENNENDKNPKLVKSLILTRENEPEELVELFDMICTYVKSSQMESRVVKLFEKIQN